MLVLGSRNLGFRVQCLGCGVPEVWGLGVQGLDFSPTVTRKFFFKVRL